ncbi:MAG: DUF1579 family protein [Chloroflexi bacterium]|nr:DUF1579 family protein [Chloroflexota bacterium]
MSGLDPFLSLAGAWTGNNRLWLPPAIEPYESPTTATLSPVVGGKLVQLAYTWSYEGDAQEGVLLIGHEPENGAVTVVWADSWHMGNKFMLCQGQIEDDRVVVRGSWSVESGPDWGWRIELGEEAETLIMRMYVITPTGEEALGVEGIYTRA